MKLFGFFWFFALIYLIKWSGIVLSCDWIHTTVLIHHMDSVKTQRKSPDGNYTRMLCAVLNQYPIKQQLYNHLPPISQNIQVKPTKHAVHCWRSKDKLISNVPLWTLTHGRANVGWPAKTYMHQHCANIGWSLEDLLGAMYDRDGWWGRGSRNCAVSSIWWWWQWWYIFSFLKLTWW